MSSDVDAAREQAVDLGLVVVAQRRRSESGRATAGGCPARSNRSRTAAGRRRRGPTRPRGRSRPRRRFISNVLSAMPYSLSTSGKAPNVAVSTAVDSRRRRTRRASARPGRAGSGRGARCSLRAPRRRSRRVRGPGPASRCRTRRRGRAPARAARRGRVIGATADRAREFLGDRSSHQAMRTRCVSESVSAGRISRWAVRRLGVGMKVYTRTGDDGTTGLFYGGRVGKDDVGPEAYGAVDEAVSALGLARAEAEPGRELHELLVQLQRELFVVGAELATAPENRAKLKPEVSRRHGGDGDAARADHRRHHRALRSAAGVRAAGREPHGAPRSTSPARSCGAPSARRSRATRAGWLDADSQVVPYLNRLADLVYTLARWQEGRLPPPSATHRSRTAADGPQLRRFAASTAPEPTCSSSRSSRARELGPGADARRRRARRHARRLHGRRPTSTASAARCSRCRPAAASARAPRCSLGVGDQDDLRRSPRCAARARCSRAGAAKVATVATTLLDAVAADVDRADAAQAFAEGVGLGAYQFLRYKSDAKPSQLEPGRRHRRAAARRCAPASTAAHAIARSGHVGARPRERTGGRRSRRPTSPTAARKLATGVRADGEGLRG